MITTGRENAVTDMDIYGDFTESDQAGIPGTMYRFLDLVNVSPGVPVLQTPDAAPAGATTGGDGPGRGLRSWL